MVNLSGKKILVTAGSTWVSIDTVRVITNIFKGKIGMTIAETAAKAGADVTLLLGPSFDISNRTFPKNIRIERFKYFNDLDRLVTKYLSNENFDAMVHSAAVSDFMVENQIKGKIKSNIDNIFLKLIPTKKIIDYVKKLAPNIFLVKFKLEVNITPEKLINDSEASIKKSNADILVANIYDPNFTNHEAYIIKTDGKYTKETGSLNIANKIVEYIYEK